MEGERNGASGGARSGELQCHTVSTPTVVTETRSIKKGSSCLAARAAASQGSGGGAGDQQEENGKHVEAAISRDDCTLGGARRDNACLKKRKVRGGKGEGCGGNKMSCKE